MEIDLDSNKNDSTLEFYGGPLGALFPFFLFVIGVVTIALSGAPDERGFWPVLLLALGISLLLAKDKTAFSNTVIAGMSQPIVMIMITAWILASIIGVLMTATGFVEALTWLAALSTFTICCIVSLSTGSSFATILICGPILYPAGGMIGAHLPTLAGAIIGGATFGDFIAPISDTTIASALSQKAKIGWSSDAFSSCIHYLSVLKRQTFIAWFIIRLNVGGVDRFSVWFATARKITVLGFG